MRSKLHKRKDLFEGQCSASEYGKDRCRNLAMVGNKDELCSYHQKMKEEGGKFIIERPNGGGSFVGSYSFI